MTRYRPGARDLKAICVYSKQFVTMPVIKNVSIIVNVYASALEKNSIF